MFLAPFLFKKNSQHVNNDNTINDTVTVSQSTVMENVASMSCANYVSFNDCKVKDFNSLQNLTCVQDISSMQTAIEQQTSSSDLSDKMMNELEQKTQSISFNLTSQQQDIINSLKVNMSTDITQNVLMNCYAGSAGMNSIGCENSDLQGIKIDQTAMTQSLLNCVQSSTENSSSSQDLQATTSNIVKQKES